MPKWAELLEHQFNVTQPEWAVAMERRLNYKIGILMAAVQIEDTDLVNFASVVETEVTAIGAAVSVLDGYIKQLLAGQGTPLPPADETAITQALADLGGSAAALVALEPPAPTPVPVEPPAPPTDVIP